MFSVCFVPGTSEGAVEMLSTLMHIMGPVSNIDCFAYNYYFPPYYLSLETRNLAAANLLPLSAQHTAFCSLRHVSGRPISFLRLERFQ
jgi:hypothetical protein